MIKAVVGTNGAPSFEASVGGIAIYLDTFAISSLAKGNIALRQRFVTALHNGADLLFSIGHGIEIGGAQGASSVAIKAFLDELGAHWYPIQFLVFDVVRSESEGKHPGQCCFGEELLRKFFEAQTSEYGPTCGRVIDLSEQFFRLGAFADWTTGSNSVLALSRKLDKELIDWIALLRAKAKQSPDWLDGEMPQLQFDPLRPATFAFTNLMRDMVLNRGYQLKDGDGIDFSHAVMASAFSNFATLDKQWKRRVDNFPLPNRGTRFYYKPELGAMVDDIESALAHIKT